MKEGSLVAFARPENLLRRAEGSVWECVVPSEEFSVLRTKTRISSAVRKSDGVHVRVVSAEKPVRGAMPAEPGLEDAYLYHMGGEAQTPASEA